MPLGEMSCLRQQRSCAGSTNLLCGLEVPPFYERIGIDVEILEGDLKIRLRFHRFGQVQKLDPDRSIGLRGNITLVVTIHEHAYAPPVGWRDLLDQRAAACFSEIFGAQRLGYVLDVALVDLLPAVRSRVASLDPVGWRKDRDHGSGEQEFEVSVQVRVVAGGGLLSDQHFLIVERGLFLPLDAFAQADRAGRKELDRRRFRQAQDLPGRFLPDQVSFRKMLVEYLCGASLQQECGKDDA